MYVITRLFVEQPSISVSMSYIKALPDALSECKAESKGISEA